MHIAVLEDDESQLALLDLWLSNAGHTVRSATTAAQFQFLLSRAAARLCIASTRA
jgi:DNA-binding response OmpR family regulator